MKPHSDNNAWPLQNCDDHLVKRVISADGTLSLQNASSSWPCSFDVAQLINGKLIVRIYDMSHSDFARILRLSNRMSTFRLTGLLLNGGSVTVSDLVLGCTPSFFGSGDWCEGRVISPGFVEIISTDSNDSLAGTVTIEVTNLDLAVTTAQIRLVLDDGSIEFRRQSYADQIIRCAEALGSARITTSITVNWNGNSSSPPERVLTDDLRDLLSLTQRSPVGIAAVYTKDTISQRTVSRYIIPEFDYAPIRLPLIPNRLLGAFIESVLAAFREKQPSWQLSHVIGYYSQAMSLNDLFSQSLGFFTALETLKSAYLAQPQNENLEYIVPRKAFRKKKIGSKVMAVLGKSFEQFRPINGEQRYNERNRLLDTVSNIFRELYHRAYKLLLRKDLEEPTVDLEEEKQQRELLLTTVKSKIGELNRRSYKLILRQMFEELNVGYSEDELKRLVAYRNDLIHSGHPDYDKGLAHAAECAVQFGYLVERTVLAILEYEGEYHPFIEGITIVPD